jgi:hypothetical protein
MLHRGHQVLQFRLDLFDFLHQMLRFLRIIGLPLSSGELLAQLLKFGTMRVDAFFEFLIHPDPALFVSRPSLTQGANRENRSVERSYDGSRRMRSTLFAFIARVRAESAIRFGLNPLFSIKVRIMPEMDPLPRREFARHFLGGIGAMSLTATVAAVDTPTPPPPALPEDPKRELPSPEVLLLTMLIAQYPSDHYTEETLQAIYGDIASDQSRSRQLRAFPLTSDDGPADAFRVYRAASDEGVR